MIVILKFINSINPIILCMRKPLKQVLLFLEFSIFGAFLAGGLQIGALTAVFSLRESFLMRVFILGFRVF